MVSPLLSRSEDVSPAPPLGLPGSISPPAPSRVSFSIKNCSKVFIKSPIGFFQTRALMCTQCGRGFVISLLCPALGALPWDAEGKKHPHGHVWASWGLGESWGGACTERPPWDEPKTWRPVDWWPRGQEDTRAAKANKIQQRRAGRKCSSGTWCNGITSASHAEGPGFNPQCVHIFTLSDGDHRRCMGWRNVTRHGTTSMAKTSNVCIMDADESVPGW